MDGLMSRTIPLGPWTPSTSDTTDDAYFAFVSG